MTKDHGDVQEKSEIQEGIKKVLIAEGDDPRC